MDQEQPNNGVETPSVEQPEKNGGAQPEKTFTQDEVNQIVEERLGREKGNIRKDLRPIIEKEIRDEIKNEEDEAKKLKRMDDDQRHEYESKKKDDRIAELEAQLNHNEMERIATDILSKKGVAADSETLSFVVADDAETTKANIDKFVALVSRKAQDNRREQFNDPVPKDGGKGSEGIEAKEFDAMSYQEKLKLKQTQPEVYKQLVEQALGGKN